MLNVEDVTRGVRSRKDEEESDNEIEVDENGRFIVREEEEDSEAEDSRVARRKRNAPHEEANEEEHDEEEDGKKGGRRIGKFQRRQQGKTSREVNEDGSRFRATKAKGDMKKGNVDPYAYISLDSRMLSRKKKSQTLGKFQNLIGAAKRGAQEAVSKRRRHN